MFTAKTNKLTYDVALLRGEGVDRFSPRSAVPWLKEAKVLLYLVIVHLLSLAIVITFLECK